jgi:ATP-dependent exoDNAse (exonuclease V) alpha subunit
VTVVARARGQRVIAAAALQAGAKLRDDYYGVLHNHLRRGGVQFTEIAAPAGSPGWVFDREQLWNRVEAGERRKDAQLARAIEISLPAELDLAQCAALLRDYVQGQFVSRGMIADMSIRRSRLGNPNAHVLLTLRAAESSGFGLKMRQWNRKGDLMHWRAAWANSANLHLARAGHAVRIDHRSFDAQQIELTPARRTGIGRAAGDLEALPEHLQARFIEQRRIAHENGSAIVEDPSIAIRALARQRRHFAREDLRRFLTSRTDGEAQLEAALSSVLASAELIALGAGEDGATLYTSRDLLAAEKALLRRAHHMTKRGDFQAIAVPGAELHGFLERAGSQWQERGKHVRHAAPAAGEALHQDEVLLLQGAEMIDLKTLERHVDAAERARASIVLVADAERLQAMGAMSPMYALIGLRSS